MLADVGRQIPQCIIVSAMTPDMLALYSECGVDIVYFIESLFEDAIEEAFERKKLKYTELVAQERE